MGSGSSAANFNEFLQKIEESGISVFYQKEPAPGDSKPAICSIEKFAKLLDIDLKKYPVGNEKLFHFNQETGGSEKALQRILTENLEAACAIDTHSSNQNCPTWMFGRTDNEGRVFSTLTSKPDLTSEVRSMFAEVKSGNV